MKYLLVFSEQCLINVICRTPCRSIFFSNLSPSPITPQTTGESTERILRFSEIPMEKSSVRLSTAMTDSTGRDKWGSARDSRLSELAPPPSAESFHEAILLDEVIPTSIVKGKQYLRETDILQNYCYTPFFFEGECASSSTP
ncbi:hypothetical protein LSM04_003430 [Trypanosoma melophagium]|uniref:uncharacterized protein n=1 Tax=Trypanosoma melophagium TaxID=715481 RepID=UPI00351AAD9B|nr:hypothetical protein LSM04_003430 [Trypanosoma melophagium]